MKEVSKVTLLSHHVRWRFQGSFYKKGMVTNTLAKFEIALYSSLI